MSELDLERVMNSLVSIDETNMILVIGLAAALRKSGVMTDEAWEFFKDYTLDRTAPGATKDRVRRAMDRLGSLVSEDVGS